MTFYRAGSMTALISPRTVIGTMSRAWAHHPTIVLVCYAAVLAVVAWVLDWHRFVPLLGTWEQLQYYYTFGAAEPYLSFEIVPRANTGGQGYPLVDMGVYLTHIVGLSLPGMRLATNLYAIGAATAAVAVFSRWFGPGPALLGVTTTILSTGFIVFANQNLAMIPSLLLCVLLVCATQHLRRAPLSPVPLAVTGLLLALLIVHYAMGRYFAIGWLVWYFGTTVIGALNAGRQLRLSARLLAPHAAAIFLVFGIGIITLALFNIQNLQHLLHPMDLFFPDNGDEIEMRPAQMLSAVIGNLPDLAIMLFPDFRGPLDLLPEILTDVRLAPFFNLWHAPFIVLGFGVALARCFRNAGPGIYPYASVHILFGLTIGLALFSEQMENGTALISARIVGGTFAMAGYIVVAILWLKERLTRFGPRALGIATVFWVLTMAGAAVDLSQIRAGIEHRAAERAAVSPSTGAFVDSPKIKPTLIKEFDYLQARYRELANRLAASLRCDVGDGKPAILRISPRIVFLGKDDWINPYMRDFNDLSPTLALYLADAGIDAGYVIAHSAFDPGFKDWGHGYAGRPRVFSGPIDWKSQGIEYRLLQPEAQEMKTASGELAVAVVVTFSDTEKTAARRAFEEAGIDAVLDIAVPTLAAAGDLGKARCVKDRPGQ
ncbi:MAG TPA: hypothetical protein DCG48_12335 [Rhodospirillaceae bacterium]|nr:hypothetical protein [Rhodospirillaceae bacterium]|tara:strand:+ start:29332 stop:31305 length:1974 start_codon:yes stop_codon:yes gene_type:complete